eukprot:CAMPEP_0176492726 /NCGR_PEP_ID=MMETSP0200_2-20121128/9163_1 /TAXON_ID=947934 /ORGANISM="Chaetoceros sp., Strain GSL56" /LENGTH=776 /DNA_ID=CAMNT_0017890329 /DNA_START=72 /DNA_END=2398 /DNA_ORIENTATION=+
MTEEHFTSVQQVPSHLLADGTLVYLPPLTAKEQSFCFAESVARHRLLEWDDSHPQDASQTKVKEGEEPMDQDKYKRESEIESEEDNHAVIKNDMKIHPLAMASATLQTTGVSELTKVINLSSLVQTGEYMGYAHVMNSSHIGGGAGGVSGGNTATSECFSATNVDAATTNNHLGHKTTDSGGGAGVGVGVGVEEEASQESNLRAQHVLHHKRKQYESATCTFQKHGKRLRVISAVQKVLDKRYLELRKRWKLSAPKHANFVMAPLRPDEMIAIDVDVYNKNDYDYDGDNRQQQQQQQQQENDGKIAQMVPRYATIELAPTFDVKQVLSILRGKQDDSTANSSNNHIQWTMAKPFHQNVGGLFVNHFLLDEDILSQQRRKKQEKEGKEKEEEDDDDDDDDPSVVRVPKLTLFFEIEKSVTGFVHSVALSSVVSDDEKSVGVEEDGNIAKDPPMIRPKRDEQSIQALQHSLFCAHVFDSIRREVMMNSSTSNKQSSSTMMKMQQGSSQVAWLSSEMEDNFLPAPSFMVGGYDDASSNVPKESAFDISPLSVIHCHEGEVKVQLNSEYALTVRLVDIQNSREYKTAKTTGHGNGGGSGNGNLIDSGSQSREQIDILCRLLLLHAQFVFHDHHKQSSNVEQNEDEMNKNKVANKRVDYSAGMMNPKQNIPQNPPSAAKRIGIKRLISPPNILQSCVALGSKVLLERKVRRVLKTVAIWQKENFPWLHFIIEWLPLSLFDSTCQFAISVNDATVIDVNISGDTMTITTFTDRGDYRCVNFA